MAHCVSNNECQWTSFDFDFQYCTLLSSCPKVDVDHDRLQSISSRTDCPLEIPCNVSGRCEGSVHKIQMTKNQCHLTCQQNDECNWYSFGGNVCIMFSTCINVDVSQTNFTTQHSSCPELIGNDKGSYADRYDHIMANGWSPFILKMIKVKDKDKNIDCGLYCEEYRLCDFFVHSPTAPGTPYRRSCFLGTFRQRIGNYSDHVGMESPSKANTYFVDKSKSNIAKKSTNTYHILHVTFRCIIANLARKV